MKWRGPFGGGVASGAVGSVVGSRARGVQYLRARTVPVNPRTPQQLTVRNAVALLAGQWQGLTAEDRERWAVYAQSVTVVNSIGDATNLSAINWFVAANTPRVQGGLEAVLAGPIVYDLGTPDWSSVNPQVEITTNGTDGELTLQNPITTNETNSSLLLYVSRPYSPGIRGMAQRTQLAAAFPANASGNFSGSYTFSSPFVASNVADSDSGNQMSYVLRLSRGDGRLSGKFRDFAQGA